MFVFPNQIFSIDYGINSILFQRGIYPAETFENDQKYGLTILMSTDTKIKDFLKNVLTQTEGNERQYIDSFQLQLKSNPFFFV